MADPIDEAARRLKRGHPGDWDKNLAAYRDAVLHAAAERQRDGDGARIEYGEPICNCPDLIDPAKQEQP